MIFGEGLSAAKAAITLQAVRMTAKALGCVAALRAIRCRCNRRFHDSIIQQALAVVNDYLRRAKLTTLPDWMGLPWLFGA